MNIAFEAMVYAREVHAKQHRKYSGLPYATHLAEVAGIVATAESLIHRGMLLSALAVAWLHDSIEDQGVSALDLITKFGQAVSIGVQYLTDDPQEFGNRAARKARTIERLSIAPGWVQTVKVADIMSNTQDIAEHDPKFGRVYIREVRALMDVLIDADPGLLNMAWDQIRAVSDQLGVI